MVIMLKIMATMLILTKKNCPAPHFRRRTATPNK